MNKLLIVPPFSIAETVNSQSPLYRVDINCENYIQYVCNLFKGSKEAIIENSKSAYEGYFAEIIRLFNIYCQWTDIYLVAIADKNTGLAKKIADIDTMLTACFEGMNTKSKSDLSAELERCILSINDATIFVKGYITIDDNLRASGKLIDWRNSILAVEEEIRRKMSPQLNLPAIPEFNISFSYDFISDWSRNAPYIAEPEDNQKWQEFSSAVNGYAMDAIYADVLKITVSVEDIDMALNEIINFAAWFDSFSKSLMETVESIKFAETDDSADMINLDILESQNNWKSVLCFTAALLTN